MPKQYDSPPENTETIAVVPDPNQQRKAGGFQFPGSLALRMRHLTKGESAEEYEALYRLRYQVYCHEAQFLNPDNYPSGLECDKFDTVAEHFLATNANNDDNPVGTVRLVKWSEEYSFPTAVYFDSLLEQLERLNYPIESTAEISRLCISKQYRKRALDGILGAGGYVDSDDRRRKYPEIILELFKIMYRSSRYNLGITHWIATFESSLYRLLDRYGVHLEPLAPEEIDYYGNVKIYGASIDQLEETMKIKKPELFAFFSEEQKII